jgi:hypothetical protein
MLKKLLRLRTVVFALPLLGIAVAVTDGPTPDCWPCDEEANVSATTVDAPQLP